MNDPGPIYLPTQRGAINIASIRSVGIHDEFFYRFAEDRLDPTNAIWTVHVFDEGNVQRNLWLDLPDRESAEQVALGITLMAEVLAPYFEDRGARWPYL